LLLEDVADEGPGVGRLRDDADLGRAAEVLVFLHGSLPRAAWADCTAAGRPERGAPRRYTARRDATTREGHPVSDGRARASRRAGARRGAPLRSIRGGRRAGPLRERGHPGAAPLAARPFGPPVHGRGAGRGRDPGPRGRRPTEPPPAGPRRAGPARGLVNVERAAPLGKAP